MTPRIFRGLAIAALASSIGAAINYMNHGNVEVALRVFGVGFGIGVFIMVLFMGVDALKRGGK